MTVFFFVSDISVPRARAQTVWITFLSITFIKLSSHGSVPRARGLTEPVLHVFVVQRPVYFFYFDISEPRARARTVWITFLSVTFTKLFSDDSVPRARALTEPVLHVFCEQKNDLPTTNFYLYCISLYGAL